jgi:hypothetical protein
MDEEIKQLRERVRDLESNISINKEIIGALVDSI